jgi:hypothetical protein
VLASFACACLVAAARLARGEESWTEFRGPAGTGLSRSTDLPREWSETRNVAWKTPIHGRGWSSPVVLGSQVWLTTATRDGRELSVIALDRETGKVVHDVLLFKVDKPEDTARYNSFASPTPVIEEGRVYVHFGSYGTAALDTATGRTIWARRDLPCNHWRGPGSSPMLWGDRLIVHYDGYDQQYALALDKKTGRTLWKADRAYDFGTDDGDMKKAFATPVVIEAAGRAQLISQAAKAVLSLDPATGRELWRVRYASHSALRAAALRERPALRRLRPRPVRALRDPARRQRRRDGDARRLEGCPRHRLEPVADPGRRPDLRDVRQGRRADLPRRAHGRRALAAPHRSARPHRLAALRRRRALLLRRGRRGAPGRARARIPRARQRRRCRGRRDGDAGDRRARDLPAHRVPPVSPRETALAVLDVS